jgi:kinesin family protein C1
LLCESFFAEEEMRNKQDMLESGLVDLKSLCAGLEERLKCAEAQTEALLLARKKDIEALQASEREQANLHQNIEKLNKELVASAQQVGVLQDVNKRLQEYNTSLQQYNTKLQSEASSAAEAISRTQKEKVAIMENLSTLRGHSTTLSSQLDSAKASLQEKLSQNKLLMDDTDRLRVELQRISEDRDQRVTQVLCFASAFP